MKSTTNIPIPIAIAFTPNYFVPASVTLLSILKSSSSQNRYQVYVLLDRPLPVHLQEQLRQLNPVRMSFSFVLVDKALDDIYVDPRYTVAASYRLLLPELLPELDRILYIDCDIIVRNNVAELFHSVDLDKKYYLAGVFESILDFQKPYLIEQGLDTTCYINSGFLLLNLKQLRTDGIVSRLLEAAQQPGLQFPDQDVINKVCRDHILGLEPIHNGIRTFFLLQYRRNFLQYYTLEQWKNVQNQANIHYTGGKPWEVVTVHFTLWWKYYRQLPDNIKKQWKEPKKLYWLALFFQITKLDIVLRKIKNLFRR